MRVYWYCVEDNLKKIPKHIQYWREHDWLLEGDAGTITTQSLDAMHKIITSIYPLATYTLEINGTSAIVKDFNDHQYELKEFRS
jgi:hypothetical protein